MTQNTLGERLWNRFEQAHGQYTALVAVYYAGVTLSILVDWYITGKLWGTSMYGGLLVVISFCAIILAMYLTETETQGEYRY